MLSKMRATSCLFVLVAIVTPAAAQEQSALLTTIEVKRLVASPDRGDHARLRDHFAALAERYERDARRQATLARMPAGNPNHPPAVPSRAHEIRLAQLKRDAAATLRELAAHHDRLARGISSTAPSDSLRFEQGEGAPLPTDVQVRALVASARTPADHKVLEEHFIAMADQHTKHAAKYSAAAIGSRAGPTRPASEASAVHYAALAKRHRDLAREARVAAGEQRRLASQG